METIDTTNKFLVSAHRFSGHDSISVGITFPRHITPDDALLLAAYLVSLAEPHASSKFEEVLEAVQEA